jgi:Cys-rich protein (TIGR01571 family)
MAQIKSTREFHDDVPGYPPNVAQAEIPNLAQLPPITPYQGLHAMQYGNQTNPYMNSQMQYGNGQMQYGNGQMPYAGNGQMQYGNGQMPQYNGSPQTNVSPINISVNVGASEKAASPHSRIRKDWSFGLFDCCTDLGLCCKAYWCICCVFGDIRSALRMNSSSTGSCFNFCCSFSQGVFLTEQRGEIRGRLQIQGSDCGDCCTICWCSCCAVIQEFKELQKEQLLN